MICERIFQVARRVQFRRRFENFGKWKQKTSQISPRTTTGAHPECGRRQASQQIQRNIQLLFHCHVQCMYVVINHNLFGRKDVIRFDHSICPKCQQGQALPRDNNNKDKELSPGRRDLAAVVCTK